MKLLPPGRLPYISADLLVAGYDTPALRLSAGMPPDADPYDLQDMFAKALAELRIELPAEESARWDQALQWCQDALESRMSPYRLAYLISAHAYPQIDPIKRQQTLSIFVGLEDDWEAYPRERAWVEANILLAARRLVHAGDRGERR